MKHRIMAEHTAIGIIIGEFIYSLYYVCMYVHIYQTILKFWVLSDVFQIRKAKSESKRKLDKSTIIMRNLNMSLLTADRNRTIRM